MFEAGVTHECRLGQLILTGKLRREVDLESVLGFGGW